VKQQIGTLVSCGPVGEAQREPILIELRVEPAIHRFDQALFRLLVGLQNGLQWDPQGVTQGEAILTPVRDISVEEAAQGSGAC
jgi:hypothetical protein